MIKVKSFEEIGQLFSGVKKEGRGFVTNFYPDRIKTDLWISKGMLSYVKVGTTCFFLVQKEGFLALYYAGQDAASLADAVKGLVSDGRLKTVTVDIVGDKVDAHKDAFLKNGFQEYTSLVRMSKTGEVAVDENELNDSVIPATREDAPQLLSVFRQYFDPLAEQVPLEEEIALWIGQGGILIHKDAEQITGFIIFEVKAATLYLRYWFVHPDYRDRKIGSLLFKKFLFAGRQTRRQLFWVIESNENAIKRYRHFGFGEERLFNYILIKK